MTVIGGRATGLLVSRLTVLAVSTIMAAAVVFVPESMQLSRTSLQQFLPSLYQAPLQAVQFGGSSFLNSGSAGSSSSSVTLSDTSTTLQQAAKAPETNQNALVSLCFVVRRPGWALCREHGQQLTEQFAALVNGGSNNNNSAATPAAVHMWGIIKEVGVDDAGLSEFYHSFFHFPLYLDVERQTFQAFGNRKIGLTTWNPIRLYRGMKEMGNRLSNKNIAGNYVGEGMIQGGILLFDSLGELRFAYEEQIGNELPMEDLQAAVDAICSGSSNNNNNKNVMSNTDGPKTEL
jgi:AhpC/TSA antioxidant enzyme